MADTVAHTVSEQPWLPLIARVGWLAKGAVYALMGLTAFTIGRGESTNDDASPEGAVAQVVANPAGRILLGTLAVGLVLYCTWRLLTAALVRGTELSDWLDRIGYVFSASIYGVIAFTAIRAVLRDVKPEDSNTVENLSRTMLESSVGRWVLLLGGVVAFIVGAYFLIEKGLRRGFLDDLTLSDASHTERNAVTAAGVVGWVGRGFVTSAVGYFVTKSAWEVDQSDARGFDRALREVATTDIGRPLVLIAGLALVAYGIFCILSLRHRELVS